MKTLKPAPKEGGNTRTTSKSERKTPRGRTSRAVTGTKRANSAEPPTARVYTLPDGERRETSKRANPRSHVEPFWGQWWLISPQSYFQMREVTDAALQRLYWACRRRTGFPGDIPDESKGGGVSTTDILQGLGLLTPNLDEPNFLSGPEQSTTRLFSNKTPMVMVQTRAQTTNTNTRDSVEDIDEHSATSVASTSSSSPSSTGPTVTMTTRTAQEMDMKTQFKLTSSLPPTGRCASLIKRAPSHAAHDDQPFFQDQFMEPRLEVDAFVDMSLCTSPSPQPPPSHLYGQPLSSSSTNVPVMPALPHIPYGHPHHPSHDLVFDNYTICPRGPGL
ncbi:hypothetical protein AYO21_11092 [Fonsecaea monophora]|uniref:Uncharacterized protein n=1 Tax=Fonsecaea monophora TaxID=254056 RepID=A0A177ERV6_9EURO|nr:hypothetical protein AYO21_11092 [Fonsecaea monophora]KAH0845774.1 hypothetical protein FOPE_11976 [Fonsecaea pedrosoi]OAG34744.1 hypothetical protein AYO21_11092 [Fonsecaea monophora]